MTCLMAGEKLVWSIGHGFGFGSEDGWVDLMTLVAKRVFGTDDSGSALNS
jgi:hypothetical protein